MYDDVPLNSPEWYAEGVSHLWPPYTQVDVAFPPLPVVGTEGCEIILADGTRLLDGISSWWSAAHGYNHPHLIAAATAQLRKMPHVMFGTFIYEPAARLAAKLSMLAPSSPQKNLSRVFFADSGSIAVEVAMKIALQYWKNKGFPQKRTFLCFQDGYHGDTFAAMAVSDPEHSLNPAFAPLLTAQRVVPVPHTLQEIINFKEMLRIIAPDTAAIILEPLVQGAGGMRFHSPDVLREIAGSCASENILFIADEIATGFARTGSLFACNQAEVVPDIMCVGKGLTGGVLTLAATLTSEEIFNAFRGEDFGLALMHGPTYMANALACAVANASLELFTQEPRVLQAQHLETKLTEILTPLREISGVVDVRTRGAIGVVQLERNDLDLYALRHSFLEEGVVVRPIKDIVYLTPPLIMTDGEVERLGVAVERIVSTWSQKRSSNSYFSL